MPEPLATWNSERDVWETETLSLFSEHSDVFSEIWPISGTTRAGRAYARPMWAHLTDASESSSSPGLLATPTSQLAVNGGSQHPDKRKAGGHGPTLADEVEHLLPTPRATRGGSHTETMELLPTPRATDGTNGGPNQRGSSGDLMLPSAVAQLLPTPTATDAKGSRGHRRDGTAYGSTSGTTLTDAAEGLLIPTPLASDAGPRGGTTGFGLMRDWSRSIGARTETPSDDGNAA